jgi:putative tryptophan/tyrosine transport system substrate-binding protein
MTMATLILTCALGLFVGSLTATAALPEQVPRIGFLATGGYPHLSCRDPDFLRGLQTLGYTEGQNISIAWRCAEGRTQVAHQLAGELVQLRVDVIVSHGLAGSLAAKAATPTIPILFGGVGDPVAGGLVPSLARPGGNATGVTNLLDDAFFATHLALLLEAAPGVTRVALLLYAQDPFRAHKIPPVETAARAVGVHLQLVDVETPQDFEAAFAAMTHQSVGALLVSISPFLATHRAQMADLAAKHRLPAISGQEFAEVGGLMSYGVVQVDLWRRVASYLDRILKGTKPGDLPVELPTTFELVINLKTAQALGLTVPPSPLFQADEVIR